MVFSSAGHNTNFAQFILLHVCLSLCLFGSGLYLKQWKMTGYSNFVHTATATRDSILRMIGEISW